MNNSSESETVFLRHKEKIYCYCGEIFDLYKKARDKQNYQLLTLGLNSAAKNGNKRYLNKNDNYNNHNNICNIDSIFPYC